MWKGKEVDEKFSHNSAVKSKSACLDNTDLSMLGSRFPISLVAKPFSFVVCVRSIYWVETRGYRGLEITGQQESLCVQLSDGVKLLGKGIDIYDI